MFSALNLFIYIQSKGSKVLGASVYNEKQTHKQPKLHNKQKNSKNQPQGEIKYNEK